MITINFFVGQCALMGCFLFQKTLIAKISQKHKESSGASPSKETKEKLLGGQLSFANLRFDLRFSRPRVEHIKASMMSVNFNEKIQIKSDALAELIIGCGQDVRQVLYHLSMVKAAVGGADENIIEPEQGRQEGEISKTTSVKIGPGGDCKNVFSIEDKKQLSLIDTCSLYLQDYNLAGLV